MKKIIVLIGLLFIFAFPHSSNAEDIVSVRLVNYVGETSSITFRITGEYLTLDPTLTLKEGVNYTLKVRDNGFDLTGAGDTVKINGDFVLVPQSYDENHIIYINDRPYLGAMEFQREDKRKIRPVNQLPLEDYLKGVVPLEVFPSWDMEALKAQSLAARTYAVSHLTDNMDDTTFFQVYGGYAWNERTTKAVDETKGEVITYKNKLIDAFYSASNGGFTESNANVWGGKSKSYYPIKKDPYDPIQPWEYVVHKEQVNIEDIAWERDELWNIPLEKDKNIAATMKKWLNRNGYPGDIIILSIPKFKLEAERFPSKRSRRGSIEVEFLQRLIDGTVLYGYVSLDRVNLNRIRPMIGGTLFKSYLIDSLEYNDNRYRMKGRGYGHGVGMSQWGASKMGEQGKTYKEIIQFYFPGTSITTVK